MNTSVELEGLVPHEVVFERIPRVRWGRLAHLPVDDDFHGNGPTPGATDSRHERSTLTGLDALLQVGASTRWDPSGLIYHTSHCGSTLLSSMLAAPGSILSLCAPKVLLDLHTLRMRGVLAAAECVDCMAAAIRALGRGRQPEQHGYVLKFNTVHLPALTAVQARFVDTPWLAMYRDPVEIMSGQLARPLINPYWLLRDYYLELPLESRLNMGIAEGLARMLGRYYALITAALSAVPRGRGLNYSEFSDAALSSVLSHFELCTSASELEVMRATSRIYSKDPSQARVFQPDALAKRASALPSVRVAAEAWAMQPYAELEAHRALARRNATDRESHAETIRARREGFQP